MLGKKYFLLVVLFHFTTLSFAQNSREVLCKVVEYKKTITIDFGKDIKYLGTDYATQIGLYDENNQLKFKSALEVASYLKAHWGWKMCGNPTYKGGKKIYTLKHKFDFDTNLHLEMELFEEYSKTHKK